MELCDRLVVLYGDVDEIVVSRSRAVGFSDEQIVLEIAKKHVSRGRCYGGPLGVVAVRSVCLYMDGVLVICEDRNTGVVRGLPISDFINQVYVGL